MGKKSTRITYLINEEGNIEGIFGVDGHEREKTSE
jgi:hypothetical protein